MPAPQIPSIEPREFVAGDSVQWTKSLADYIPGDGFTLKYRFIGGTLDKTIVADTSTGAYLLTLLPADTAAFVAGVLVARLFGWMESATDKHVVYDEVVTIQPNFRTATATQLLTHNEKVVSALEALVEGRSVTDIESYMIGGRSVTKLKPEEVLRWLGIYRARVWRERNPGKSFPTHAARMVAAD